MSTVDAIEKVMAGLTAVEREALESRLLTRRFGLDILDNAGRTELLMSLDEAESDIPKAGRIPPGKLRQAVRSWTGE